MKHFYIKDRVTNEILTIEAESAQEACEKAGLTIDDYYLRISDHDVQSRKTCGQEGFSTLWDGYATPEEAKKARDQRAKELKAEGYFVRRSVLKNQLKKYESFGVPDGRSCDVYMIDYSSEVR